VDIVAGIADEHRISETGGNVRRQVAFGCGRHLDLVVVTGSAEGIVVHGDPLVGSRIAGDVGAVPVVAGGT